MLPEPTQRLNAPRCRRPTMTSSHFCGSDSRLPRSLIQSSCFSQELTSASASRSIVSTMACTPLAGARTARHLTRTFGRKPLLASSRRICSSDLSCSRSSRRWRSDWKTLQQVGQPTRPPSVGCGETHEAPPARGGGGLVTESKTTRSPDFATRVLVYSSARFEASVSPEIGRASCRERVS